MASSWAPDRRDIIWINHDPKADKEMPGQHPLLVLSVKAFNEKTGIVIGLPVTHSALNEDNPFAVKFSGPKGEACYVLCHQPKSFDWRARRARAHRWGQVAPAVFRTACEELGSILEI